MIDQPEDDLDNHSVFNDLIPFIKENKKERQILVVYQRGKNSTNKAFRFEYHSWSIEDNWLVYDINGDMEEGILNRQGI